MPSATPPSDFSATVPAMLLAAGRGERMRPLTDTTPKPLLAVHGKPLMQWPLEALARAGCPQTVINTAWLGDQISEMFGHVFGLQPSSNIHKSLSKEEQSGIAMALRYSHEGRDFGAALETAGGIVRALPQLGPVFWVLAGDVFAPDFVFSAQAVHDFVAGNRLAHLWLVPNPGHNPRGDFGLEAGSGAESARQRPTATLHLQHAGLVPPGAFCCPLVQHPQR